MVMKTCATTVNYVQSEVLPKKTVTVVPQAFVVVPEPFSFAHVLLHNPLTCETLLASAKLLFPHVKLPLMLNTQTTTLTSKNLRKK